MHATYLAHYVSCRCSNFTSGVWFECNMMLTTQLINLTTWRSVFLLQVLKKLVLLLEALCFCEISVRVYQIRRRHTTGNLKSYKILSFNRQVFQYHYKRYFLLTLMSLFIEIYSLITYLFKIHFNIIIAFQSFCVIPRSMFESCDSTAFKMYRL